MNMHSSESGLLLNGERQRRAARIGKTNWGYIIGPGPAAQKRAGYGEVLAVFACLMFGTFAYAPWILPAAFNDFLIMPYKIAATAMFFTFSIMNYRISHQGLAFEVQIDTLRAKLSTARRNRGNAVTVLEKFAFTDIESVYMKRSKSPNALARVFVQPAGRNRPLVVAKGPARDLEPVLRLLIAELRAEAPRPRVVAQRPKARGRAAAAGAVFAAN
jgi:hypothetical protein